MTDDEVSLLEYAKFFWPTLTVAAGIALSASTAGVFVLLRGEALLALTLPELVAAGAALALKLGWPTYITSAGTVLTALLVLAWLKYRNQDLAILPSLFVGCMCVTILLIAHAGEHLNELKDLIAGFDVAVSEEGARWSTPILILCGIIIALLYRRWLLLAQAPAVAQLAGLRPAFWNTLFLCLLSTIVLVGSTETGIAMVLAMLFLPAAVALLWCKRLLTALTVSATLALLILAAGFVASIKMEWPLSQSVGGIGFGLLTLSYVVRQFVG